MIRNASAISKMANYCGVRTDSSVGVELGGGDVPAPTIAGLALARARADAGGAGGSTVGRGTSPRPQRPPNPPGRHGVSLRAEPDAVGHEAAGGPGGGRGRCIGTRRRRVTGMRGAGRWSGLALLFVAAT